MRSLQISMLEKECKHFRNWLRCDEQQKFMVRYQLFCTRHAENSKIIGSKNYQ